MSELLREVLNERATATDRPQLDLDAIVAAGDRRIRRKGIVTAVAATTAVVVITATAASIIGSYQESQPDRVQPAGTGGDFEQRTTSYSTGSVIHYGNHEIDVAPHSLSSFVQTDDGFVFTDKGGLVYLATADTVNRLGQTNQPYGTLLAAGDGGPYVTWLDTDASTFKVYDTAARREVASVEQPPQPKNPGEFDLLAVLALDGSTAYWHTADGVVSYDIDSDQTEVVKAGATTQWLADVADGTLARMSSHDQSITISRDPHSDGPTVPGFSEATLSPDAHYVATDPNDSEQVFEAATGKDVTPTTEGYSFTAVVQWTDADDYVALGIPQGNAEDELFDLLTCSVSSKTCTPAAKSVGVFGNVQFPIGEDLSDS